MQQISGARLKIYRGTWCAVWRDRGATRRCSLRTTDLQDAKRRLIDWKESIKRRSVGTVGDIAALYMEDRQDRASAGTMKYAWQALAPVFGHLFPEHVTAAATRSYAKKRRAAGKAESTIVRELGFLRTALRWHDRNTPAVVDLPASPLPQSYHLTSQEWACFKEATKAQPHLHVFAVVAYATAGRATAILELTWDRVDFDRGLVDLNTSDSNARGGKGRAVVPMNKSMRAVLVEAKKAALSDHVVEWAGRPIKSVKKSFSQIACNTGLPKLTPHILRHTAAVRMAEAGLPMSEIAQYLGHSNERVTYRVYARYSPHYLRNAAAALE